MEAGLNSTAAVMTFTRLDFTGKCDLLPFFGFSKAIFSTRLLATYNIQFHIRRLPATNCNLCVCSGGVLGPWCFLFQVPFRSLRCYPRPSVSDPFSLIDFLPFLAVTARLSVNQTLSTKIRIATSMGFLAASSMLREKIKENTVTTSRQS